MVGLIGDFDGMHADIGGMHAARGRMHKCKKPLTGLVVFQAERGGCSQQSSKQLNSYEVSAAPGS